MSSLMEPTTGVYKYLVPIQEKKITRLGTHLNLRSSKCLVDIFSDSYIVCKDL